ncbi:hypothetical protein [Streptomyces sp. NPDC054838]
MADADGHELFHRTTPLQDHLGRFESSLSHAREFYEGNDYDRAALAIEDMAEQLKEFMPGATDGALRTVARFMVERESVAVANALEGRQKPTEPPSACDSRRCRGGALQELLGHDPLGHMTVNSLAHADIFTSEDLITHGWQYVLDATRVGQAGFRRIEERVPGFPTKE